MKSTPHFMSTNCFLLKLLSRTSFILIILLLLCSCQYISESPAQTSDKDITGKTILLGNPFNKSTYARNVWDMQVFNNLIYLAHGDLVSNAGPIPIIYYDPQTSRFVNEYTTDDEQLNNFRVLNNKLYAPGNDARESWDYGNYYVLDNGVWQKLRTIPHASHVFDLAYFKGNLYSANGSESIQSGEVMMSKDFGRTWISQMPQYGSLFLTSDSIAYTLFQFKDKLYAVGEISWPIPFLRNILVMDGSSSLSMPVTKEGLTPGAPDCYWYKIIRPNVVNNNLVYLGVRKNYNMQWCPEGLYVAPEVNKARRITLPEKSALPTDILVRGSTVYVLSYLVNANGEYKIIVYKSEDLQKWNELFRFNCATFARSFEELNGDFYFGLGCDADLLSTSTGNVLKIPQNAYSQDIIL